MSRRGCARPVLGPEARCRALRRPHVPPPHDTSCEGGLTGMLGLYLATRRAVEPPRVSTTMRAALTCARDWVSARVSA